MNSKFLIVLMLFSVGNIFSGEIYNSENPLTDPCGFIKNPWKFVKRKFFIRPAEMVKLKIENTETDKKIEEMAVLEACKLELRVAEHRAEQQEQKKDIL